MAYCPECGSEVAENDIFCPYCGISLQPVKVGSDEEDAFSETIAIIPEDKSDFSSNKQPFAASAETAKESVSETPAQDEVAEEKEPEAKPTDVTSENINLKTESVEIPAELFDDIKDSPATSDVVSSQNEEEAESPEEYFPPLPDILSLKNEQAQASPIETTSTENETSAVAEEKSFENKESYIEAEKPEESPFEATSSESTNIPEFSDEETDIDKTPPLNLSAPEEDKRDSQNFAPRFDESGSSESSFKQTEGEDIGNQAPIAMPADELDEPVRPSQESVFDSVQIVQKEEKEPVEEAPKVEAPVQESAEQSQEHKEGRPFTTPNIGVGDTDGKSASKLKPLDEGTVLNGRYEIIRKIGGGGMGAVYLASDKNLGGVLRAVKEMVQSYIEETQQEKAVNDFKRESLLLTSLEHQAIPTIYDYFYDDKEQRFYLVMKYISGGDLSSRLRSSAEGRIDEKSVTEWAIQIADVLDYLHNRQPPIVYRDLKPANIMIDGNSGRIMLIDFGIARWINKEEKGVTAVGTMGYAPPELFSGNVEPRSDVYSLGSTMFHLLTGADPQSNPLLIFDFQKHPRPRQINSQLSDQIERILMRAVEYNSNKRFASAAEMRDALQKHLEDLKAGRVTFGVKEVAPAHAFPEQPVFCGFCGQKIVASDMFCAFCGSKQPLAGQNIQPSVYARPQTAKLTIVGTSELDSPSFTLEKEDNLVGRRDPMSNIFPEIDLSKFDPQTKISRRHARIWREGNKFMVEDLGSSNGTVLLPVMNDTVRLLPHQPHVLTSGDKLRLGDTTMHFIIG